MEVMTCPIGKNGATLTCYLQRRSQAISGSNARPGILILGGGGFEFVSDPEKEPVAAAYAAKGYQTFTLDYTVGEKCVFPVPQREAFEALALIRARAEEWGVDPHRLALAGFSAGGYVAASCGVFWKDARVNPCATPEDARPDALVLVYPCITAGEYAYPGVNGIHGKGTEYPDLLSLERCVTADMPPAFLCHTAQDTCVPSLNSLYFAEALARSGVPYELHVYKEGPHGMSLATKAVSSPILQTLSPEVRQVLTGICARFSEWFEKSAQFLELAFKEAEQKSAQFLKRAYEETQKK